MNRPEVSTAVVDIVHRGCVEGRASGGGSAVFARNVTSSELLGIRIVQAVRESVNDQAGLGVAAVDTGLAASCPIRPHELPFFGRYRASCDRRATTRWQTGSYSTPTITTVKVVTSASQNSERRC